jgi:hypothetical protein
MFGGAAAAAASPSSASPFATMRGTPGVSANPADTLPSPSPFGEASPFAVPGGDSPFEAAPGEASPFAGPSADAAVAAELAAYAPSPSPSPLLESAAGAVVQPGIGTWGAGADASRASTYVGPDDDLVPVGQSPVRAMLATLLGSKRNIAFVVGGAVLLLIVIAFATGGSKSTPKTVASTGEPAKKTPVVEPAATEKAPEEKVAETPAGVAREKVAAVETTTTTTTTTTATETPAETPVEAPAVGSDASAGETTETTAPVKPTARVVRPAGSKKTLGGKQVVLEYDAQAKETAKPVAAAPKNEQAAIMRARSSYAQGNQKLLAGDWDGAIVKYRQSLANYPGYVAGYRGLGLAFMQKGDKPKALQALRLYISSVPTAKDAAIIRKRIASLQK